ncbi:MAG: hypothetical protein FWC47_11905 [Oscillospiraceae bacterium]|nr:hypothetical protein [Oscillospiraceae bacterium]
MDTKLSLKLEQFLKTCDEVKKQYDFNFEIVGKCDEITCDYLHKLELSKTTSNEKAKMATAERKNRLKRREAKDIVEVDEPLRKFILSPEGTKAINMLRQTLGDIRKVEKYHENRTYVERNKI